MDVRITARRDGEVLMIEIAGRLTQDTVPELRAVAQAATGPVSLDLHDLRSADPAGLRALLELRSAGATLTGVTPYISLLLAAEGKEEPFEKAEGKGR